MSRAHRLVQFQVPEAQVAVVVLHPFAPQPDAVLLAQQKGRRIGMRLVVRLLLVLVVVQPRLEALRPESVGPAVHLHLEDAQVDPQLDLAPAVVAGDDPHQNRLGIELPLRSGFATGRSTCRHCTEGKGGRGKAECCATGSPLTKRPDALPWRGCATRCARGRLRFRYSTGSRLTGSMTFVFRSTASTMVRCSAPSRLLATIGRHVASIGQVEADGKRAVAANFHRLAAKGHVGVRLGHAVNDQFGIHLELEPRRR